MCIPTLLFFALFTLSCLGDTLTYQLQPNEKACFYAMTTSRNEKIAFYYSVIYFYFQI